MVALAKKKALKPVKGKKIIELVESAKLDAPEGYETIVAEADYYLIRALDMKDYIVRDKDNVH